MIKQLVIVGVLLISCSIPLINSAESTVDNKMNQNGMQNLNAPFLTKSTKYNKARLEVLDPPEEQWSNTFGGTDYDCGNTVQQTMDGGYIIAGTTYSYGAGACDAWLIKTDPNGNKQWDKTFGGTYHDYGNSAQQTTDGGYIITGATYVYGTGNPLWLIKTDESGNEQWNKTFGAGSDEGFSVLQTTDGGYIITGETYSYGAGNADVWLLKTDASGNEQWNKTYGGTDWDHGYSVQQTTDGGYIITGETGSYGAGQSDVWLIKTDESGNEQWNKTFGESGWERGFSVQQTTDGGYIITGYIDASQGQVWLIKTDVSGNKQWDKTFGGTAYDYGHSVQLTTDGGYLIAGETESYGAGSADVWLIKTDESGNEQWNKTFGGTDTDAGSTVQLTTDGGLIIVGSTCSHGAGSYDVWLIKAKCKNQAPEMPILEGPTWGIANVQYNFTINVVDPNQDDIYYKINWSGNNSDWIGPYSSGSTIQLAHTWSLKGIYNVQVKLKDTAGLECNWSNPLNITIHELNKAILLGKYTNMTSDGGFITLEAMNLWTIFLKPSFHILHNNSGEKIMFAHTYKGLLRNDFVIGVFKVVN